MDYKGKPITFQLTIPESKEPSIDLGEIVVDVPRDSGGEPVTEEAPKGEVIEAGTSSVRENPTTAPPQGEERVERTPDPKSKEEGTVPPLKEAMPVSVQKEAESSNAASVKLPGLFVYFGFDKTEPSSANDQAYLLTLGRIIGNVPDKQIILEGHADRIGAGRYNQRLGMGRALAVAAHLDKMHIGKGRIKSIRSLGESRPVCDSLLESCRKLNRRCVIRFAD
jgi:outer membrane protein OmpA-like peptidoglycan-associated protein